MCVCVCLLYYADIRSIKCKIPFNPEVSLLIFFFCPVGLTIRETEVLINSYWVGAKLCLIYISKVYTY